MWVRGLKRNFLKATAWQSIVAPHVGAWIETKISKALEEIGLSRTPCGCVD